MTTPRPSAAGRDGQPSDWATVLDELEGEVLAAEATLTAGDPASAEPSEDGAAAAAARARRVQDWVPPSGLGPLPQDLRERAARLLQHQLAVAEELVERIIQSRRQRDVAARMSYGPPRPVASFIDRAL
ncbi:hypothetical protein [Geodermatophilus sp. SYSU D01105]